MIIMSVDFGDARTGIAVCGKSELIASPVTEPATDYVPPTEYIPDDSGSQGTDYSGGDSSYSDGTGQSEW